MFFKKKNKLQNSDSKVGEIGSPYGVSHNVHVNSSFQWSYKGGEPDVVFDLLEEMGEGSFGVVWKAQHKETGYVLAIKAISYMEDMDDTCKPDSHPDSILAKEIEILRLCNHPNIVSYLGSCWNKKDLWIMMDYCALGSVRDLLESANRPLTEKEIAFVCAETLKGLDYLHTNNILHRDVKAANILVNEKGDIKIADFGVSQQTRTTLVSGNTIVGTPLYISPEVIKQRLYSPKLDIWALGVTLIELAEGFPPYSEMNPIRAMYMIPSKPSPTFQEPKNWSKEFKAFLERCMKKDPNERPTAKELLSDPFVTKTKGPEVLKDLIYEANKERKKKKRKQLKTLLRSRSKNKSDIQSDVSDDDYGTMIVKEGAQGKLPVDSFVLSTSPGHGIPMMSPRSMINNKGDGSSDESPMNTVIIKSSSSDSGLSIITGSSSGTMIRRSSVSESGKSTKVSVGTQTDPEPWLTTPNVITNIVFIAVASVLLTLVYEMA